MDYGTIREHEERKAVMVCNNVWSGSTSQLWAKTIKTLRAHYVAGRWDRERARSCVRNNINHAVDQFTDTCKSGMYAYVLEIAEDMLLDSLERMYSGAMR